MAARGGIVGFVLVGVTERAEAEPYGRRTGLASGA